MSIKLQLPAEELLQTFNTCCYVQMAAKAQRASVEPAEVVRYEEYDSRHGARYVDADAAAVDMDDDW